jgi:mono/diheme cytochrome c family protein
VTFPISRQGLEQIALLLAVGAVIFAALALWRWRRGAAWRRAAISAGALGGLVAIALVLAYTVAPNIPTPPVPLTARVAQDPRPDSPERVAAGGELYRARCAVCHGARGRGDGPAAFTLNPRPVDLTVHVPQHAPGEVHYWISEGIPGTPMPAWKGELTEEQRWDIVRFLYALAAGRAG